MVSRYRRDDQVEQIFEFARAHKRARNFIERDERAQARVFAAQFFLFERVDNRGEQLFGENRLDEETDETDAQRVERDFPGAVPGDDDAGDVGVDRADLIENLDAGRIGQINIRDNQIEGFAVRQRRRFRAGCGIVHAIAGVHQNRAGLRAQFGVVFEQENFFFRHFTTRRKYNRD